MVDVIRPPGEESGRGRGGGREPSRTLEAPSKVKVGRARWNALGR